jgi:hypothetical protein
VIIRRPKGQKWTVQLGSSTTGHSRFRILVQWYCFPSGTASQLNRSFLQFWHHFTSQLCSTSQQRYRSTAFCKNQSNPFRKKNNPSQPHFTDYRCQYCNAFNFRNYSWASQISSKTRHEFNRFHRAAHERGGAPCIADRMIESKGRYKTCKPANVKNDYRTH